MKTTLILQPKPGATIVGDGSPVDRSGEVTPAGTYLVSRNEDLLCVYVPGGHHWSGRGERRYSGGEYEIYRAVANHEGQMPKLGDRIVPAELVLTIPVKRVKP